MRKQRRRWGTIRVIGAALLVCMGIEAVMPFANTGTAAQPSAVVGATTQPAKSKLCSVGTAVKYAANQLGLTTTGSGYGAYHDALVAAGILEENHLKDYEKNICAGEVAILASGIMDYLNEEVDEDIYNAVLEKDRISNLGKIAEKYKEPIAKVFSAGVMVGKSNGKYSQDRKFISSETMTCAGMKNVVLKAMGKKKRSIMSPDGQLTRTTNLPKNYKQFSYILASFPNSFYEHRYRFQYHIYFGEPKRLEQYSYPVDRDKMIEKFNKSWLTDDMIEFWRKRVEENFTYRLNFNYKTVDQKWIKGLRGTYFDYGDYSNGSVDERLEKIKNYVKNAKKNKVILKSDKIVVDSSTLYFDGGTPYFRVYVKYKIVSADKLYGRADIEQETALIYSKEHTALDVVKKGVWLEGVYDVGLATVAMNDDGTGYGVEHDTIADRRKPDLSRYSNKKVFCLY